MTVAVGLVCKDGVLVASDSMGSDLMTAQKVTKVRTLGNCPAVWTAAGSVYVQEEVEAALGTIPTGPNGSPAGALAKPTLSALRKLLQNTIHPAMRKAYESALSSAPLPPGAVARGFETEFLLLGYASGQPWFLEFARDGQINWHHEAGFYAVGSGGAFATVAHALMAHYLNTPLSLEQGMKVAYRAIETTCEVSIAQVGLPVQMAIVNDEGARVLRDDEIAEVGLAVDRWKTLEVDTLLMDATEAAKTAEHDLPQLGESGESSPTPEI